MMLNVNSLGKGRVICLGKELYVILDHRHVKPGKGGAFVRLKLKSIQKGKIVDKTLRPDEKVEEVYLEKKELQYMYLGEEGRYIFMDLSSYEQYEVEEELLSRDHFFLKGGLEVVGEFVGGEELIRIMLPMFVELEVEDAEPGLRGDTVTSVTKRVRLETGYELQVPLFVGVGDQVKVDTRSGEYMMRIGG